VAVAAVIGAAGRMGGWFANFLSANGYSVIVCDKDEEAARELARKKGFKLAKDPAAAAKPSQIAIFATPTIETKALLKRVGPQIPRTTTLVEISSVKEPLKETLKQLVKSGVQILSIHPMFGHGTKNPTGRTVIVAQRPPRNRAATEFLLTLRGRGVKIVETDLANHDRIVAVTLALPHFLNFAMINTLMRTGITPNKARGVGGTTFKLQMLVAEALYHERLSNEASILADNRYATEILDAFAEEVNRIRAETKSRHAGKLLRTLKNGANYVSKDTMFDSAYDRFNAAVEASVLN